MKSPELLDCEEVLRVIFAYLDGELEAAEHARVGAHLERCRSCFSRADFERRLKDRLGESRTDPVPPALEHRIRSLVRGFADPGTGETDRPAVQDV